MKLVIFDIFHFVSFLDEGYFFQNLFSLLLIYSLNIQPESTVSNYIFINQINTTLSKYVTQLSLGWFPLNKSTPLRLKSSPQRLNISVMMYKYTHKMFIYCTVYEVEFIAIIQTFYPTFGATT